MPSSVKMPTLYSKSVLLDAEAVQILDRRVFPFAVTHVVCRTLEEVATAIEDMVTQSNGPYYAAGAGMVLAARAAVGSPDAKRRLALKAAGDRLKNTRPTNNNIHTAVSEVLSLLEFGITDRDTFAADIEAAVRNHWAARRGDLARLGRYAASVVSDGEGLMTHCWSEGAITETLAALLEDGKTVTLFCPETRPYLQGARLTAHSAAEMGIDTVVITDGMGAHAMNCGKVSMFMTAADRVTMSGHIINKVGTLQGAIAARHFGIPYFATVLDPDPSATTPEDVPMEERNGDETLSCLGRRTASPLVRGWYPSFDITPPSLVSGIVTRHGLFPAAALAQTVGPSSSRRTNGWRAPQ